MKPSICLILLCCCAVAARAQGTAFTYQGRLNDGPSLANGLYDLKFTLFDSPTSGDAAGPLTNSAVAVSNGLFTVPLDFGPNVFNGHPNFFLEIGVRAAGGGAFTTLSPRQPVTPSPYAIHADSATKLFNGAVTRLNNLTDNVTLTAGQNVTITPSGNTLTIGASGINPWQVNGSNTFYNAGRVGIGVSTPSARLQINAPSVGDGVNIRGTSPGYSLSDAANTPRVTLAYASAAGFFSTDAAAGDSVLRTESGKLLLQNGFLASALALNNNQVGIGTPTPQAKLDVRGDIRLGPSGQFRATSGEENLRIVRGVVAANGSIIAGSGFTVTHNSVGNYVINFNTPFAGPPSITGTATNEGFETDMIVMTQGVTSANATLVTHLDEFAGGWFDMTFHFIAVGPR